MRTEHLSAFLKELRLLQGLDHEQAGEVSGTSRAAVYAHESTSTTARLPTPRVLTRLLDAYKASPAQRQTAWFLLRQETERLTAGQVAS